MKQIISKNVQILRNKKTYKLGAVTSLAALLAACGDALIPAGLSFNAGAGADDFVGGEGSDTVSYAASSAGVLIDLAGGAASGGDAEGDSLTSIENIVGSASDDTITGNAEDNIIEGGGGGDTLDGGDGIDTISYASSGAGVIVDISPSPIPNIGGKLASSGSGNIHGGDAQGDTLVNFENIIGSAFNDELTGDAGVNVIDGGAGDDKLFGGAGNDTLNGGAGKDYLFGGIGADILDGGAGNNDFAFYTFSSEAVNINLGTNTYLGGEAQGDTLTNIENLIGSDYNDTITGDAQNNQLEGRAGNDIINGGAGDDYIFDGDGSDTIDGGAGVDTVEVDFDVILNNIVIQKDLNSIDVINGGNVDRGTSIEFIKTPSNNVDVKTIWSSLNVTEQAKFNNNEIEFLLWLSDDDGYNYEGLDYFNFDVFNGDVNIDNLLSKAYTADYTGSATAVGINLETEHYTGGAAGDSFDNIQFVVGSTFADTITLSAGTANILVEGGAGGDTLTGTGLSMLGYIYSDQAVNINLETNTVSGGDADGDIISGFNGAFGSQFVDTLTGDASTNMFEGGKGADIIDGGDGIDMAAYMFSSAAVNVNLSTGINTGGDAQGDTLINIEGIIGSAFDDILTGDANDNILFGISGADTINGGGGVDGLSVFADSITYTINKNNNSIDVNNSLGVDEINSIEVIVLAFETSGIDVKEIWDDLAAVEQAKFTDEADFLLWLGDDAGYNYEGL